MHVFGKSESEIAEQLYMLGYARKPLLTAYDMRCAHEVVINSVGKVVGRYSVRFEQYEILVVFGNFKCALDKIGEFCFFRRIAVSQYA